MAWTQSVKDEVLVACMRCCCICHKPCGVKMELHHIKQEAEGGDSTFDNCIPLCFECHADVGHYNVKHPKGSKYSEKELRMHRDSWLDLVKRGPQVDTDENLLAMDRRLATEIHECMITFGVYRFLLEDSMKGSFRYGPYSALCKLGDKLHDPDMEFHEASLEAQRAHFHELILESMKLAYGLVHVDERDWATTDFAVEVPHDEFEKRMKAVEKVDKNNSSIVSAYDDLFRLFRKRLGLDLRF